MLLMSQISRPKVCTAGRLRFCKSLQEYVRYGLERATTVKGIQCSVLLLLSLGMATPGVRTFRTPDSSTYETLRFE
jgi:hypothetical protein